MDCTEAQRRILDGTAGDALRAHLEACPACHELARDRGALARLMESARPGGELPPGLLEALRQDLARERHPLARLRSLSTPTRVALALVGGLAVLALGLLKLRPDIHDYPVLRLVLELGSLGLVGLGVGWLWLRPLHRPPLPGWLAAALALLALALPWVISALPAAHTADPASLAGAGDDLVRRAVACFVYGSLIALPLALLLALLGRGARRRVRLALLPAAAGALAGLVSLNLHCPLTAPVHLLAGHAPIVLVAVLLAAAIHRVARR